jgi:hypothetical protein
MEEPSYRIISQADATFAIERTGPNGDQVISGHFQTEAEARSYVAKLAVGQREEIPRR